MTQRTQGKIAIFRDHPNPETANSLAYLRLPGSELHDDEIAMMFGARPGTEQEANAEFIVTAWNSHDQLVAAAQAAKAIFERQGWLDTSPDPEALALRQLRAALVAAGAA